MKVENLQLHLTSLAQLLRNVGGTGAKTAEELDELCRDLQPYADRRLKDLLKSIAQAEEIIRTGTPPPRGRSAKAKVDPQVVTELGTRVDRARNEIRVDGIALHRLILGEVTRFPGLGEIFWRAGPERQRLQIEAFLKSATAAGTLTVSDTRLAAEQFVSLVRSDVQLRHLLRLDANTDESGVTAVLEAAVATFMRAFASRKVAPGGRL